MLGLCYWLGDLSVTAGLGFKDVRSFGEDRGCQRRVVPRPGSGVTVSVTWGGTVVVNLEEASGSMQH